MQQILNEFVLTASAEERMYLISLAQLPNIRRKNIETLLNYYQSFKNIWGATESELKNVLKLPGKFVESFSENQKKINPGKLIKELHTKEIKTVTLLDGEYPDHLKEIYDPPLVIYYQGEWDTENTKAMGIVGSRRTTVYGEKIAEKFGRELAEAGFLVVSGLARGVDSHAHRGCLEAGGETIAVLGCGLDINYPRENAKLTKEIIKNGVVMTEYPLGTAPLPMNFPARNRIIAGLSLGVLVVEAAVKSGALITADFAMESGRDVFAIPGPITSPNSEGTNNLIKQGAKLVGQIGDILEEYNFQEIASPTQQPKKIKLSSDEELIYNALDWNPLRVEELVKKTGWAPSKVQTVLTLLELEGLIEQRPGRQFIRKNI